MQVSDKCGSRTARLLERTEPARSLRSLRCSGRSSGGVLRPRTPRLPLETSAGRIQSWPKHPFPWIACSRKLWRSGQVFQWSAGQAPNSVRHRLGGLRRQHAGHVVGRDAGRPRPDRRRVGHRRVLRPYARDIPGIFCRPNRPGKPRALLNPPGPRFRAPTGADARYGGRGANRRLISRREFGWAMLR